MPAIKVMSAGAVKAMVAAIAPEFERASGDRLDLNFGTAGALRERVKGGETADLVVLSESAIAELAKLGLVVPGTVTDLGRTVTGVIVREGAAKPDISTPDAFKQALLTAKSIAYSNPAAGGASGVYIAKLLDRIGIADQLKAKTKHPPAGGNSANLVVSGEADLAIQQEPEVIAVTGVDLVGPLPAALNNITRYAAGPNPASAQAAACQTLVKFLHSPAAQAVFKARGLTPA